MEQTIISQPEDITLADILSAINGFANATEQRFTKIETTITTLATKKDLESLATKQELQEEIGKLKVKMVTKDYLDDKLSELQGDLNDGAL